MAKARAILEDVRYWETEEQVLKILETDCLSIVNIINRNWKIPCEVAEMVEEIQEHIRRQHIQINHIFREGNKLAEYMANLATNESTTLVYNSFTQLSKEGHQIININKAQIPSIRIRIKRL